MFTQEKSHDSVTDRIWMGALCLTLLIGLSTFSSTEVWTNFTQTLSYESVSGISSLVQSEPGLARDLQVITVDDKSVKLLGARTPNAEEIGLVLHSIDKRKPKAIIILQSMEEMSADPMLAQSFGEMESPIYAVKSAATTQNPDFPAITDYGHEGFGRLYQIPLNQGDDENSFVHVGLFASEEVRFVSSRKAPFSSVSSMPSSEVAVRLIPLERISEQSISFVEALRVAESGSAHSSIDRHSTVVLVPEMFRGNESMPSSHQMSVSVASTVLSDDWVHLWGSWWLAVIALVLSSAALQFLKTRQLVVAVGFVSAFVVLMSSALFAYGNIFLSWSEILIFAWAPVVCLLPAKLASEKTRSIGLREALDGVVSPKQLKALEKNPNKLDLKPREQSLTVLFVDIEAFSMIAQSRDAEDLFLQLRECIGPIADCVHRYNGVVDKILGDGLLCYFGFCFDGTQMKVEDSAQAAVDCAIEIQQLSLNQNLNAAEREDPIFLLRIGVHTEYVYLGDLSATRKMQPTIIGHGVNYAKRLESGCSSGSILISEATRNLVQISDQIPLHEKHIVIKRHQGLVKSFELQALAERPEDFSVVSRKLSAQLGVERIQTRFSVPENIWIGFQAAGVDDVRILDFSMDGFRILLPKYCSVGVELNAQVFVKKSDEMPRQVLTTVVDVPLEVRWSHLVQGVRMHGVSIKSLADHEKKRLLSDFNRVISEKKQKVAA